MIKTGAIVLSHLKYGEHSVIATLYTEHKGRQSVMVKGAFSKHAPMKASLFRPLYILEVTLHYQEKRSLQYIRDVTIAEPFLYIPFDPVKSSIALFMSEVLYKTLREEEANSALYVFLTHTIQLLDLNRVGTANFHLLFLLHLSRYIGFYPSDDMVLNMDSPLFREHDRQTYHEFMQQLLHMSFEQLGEIRLNHNQRNVLLDILLEYYAFHVEGFGVLQTVPVLKTLFS